MTIVHHGASTVQAAPDPLRAALAYARRFSWAVLPLHTPSGDRCSCAAGGGCPGPGKHPRPGLGVYDATTDPDVIRSWWAKWPGANIGIACGRASGLVALDVDPRHGGDEALRELEVRHGPLPETAEALTGGGGRHVFFRYPEGGIPSRTLAPGLELKSDGSLIVAAPSLHASGRRYTWEVAHRPGDVPLTPLPAWIIDAVGDRRQGRPVGEWRRLVREGALEGSRNTTVTSLAGHLLRRGVDPYVTLDLLVAWAAVRCRPPLDPDEVARVVDSVARAEARRRKGVRRGA